MKVLVCPDTFKGTLPAPDVAEAVDRCLGNRFLIRKLPLSDGGEGFLDVLCAHLPLKRVRVDALRHDHTPIVVEVGVSNGLAVVESARVVGLDLISPCDREIVRFSTAGLGLVIRHLVEEHGVSEIVVGLGGSGTGDAGAGMLWALGARLLGIEAEGPPSPAELRQLKGLDLAPVKELLNGVQLRALCDVNNPLTGPRGAVSVFAEQKGAGPEEKALLVHITEVLSQFYERSVQGSSTAPGTGAAGGLGAAFMAIGAVLLEGASEVARQVHLDEHMLWSEIVITGEGRFDRQSFMGKVVGHVIERAGSVGRPVLVLSGDVPVLHNLPDHVHVAHLGTHPGQSRSEMLRRICESLEQLEWGPLVRTR